MSNLIKAFFFKLAKDLTFRVTLLVGVGVSVLMMFLYMLIDGFGNPHVYCSGNNLFVTSFNPAQNFGLAIPINLITFTVLEFTYGIIRNKIIAGNSKVKIYLSLFLTGLIFSLSLLFIYVGLSTLLGTIVGGFNENGTAIVGVVSGNWGTFVSPEFLWRYMIANIIVYITITAFAIFISSLFRNVGPSIPVCILLPFILGAIIPLISQIPDVAKKLGDSILFLNPFQVIGNPELIPYEYEGGGYHYYRYLFAISDYHLIATTVCNLGWTAIFVGLGTFIFVKRDIK